MLSLRVHCCSVTHLENGALNWCFCLYEAYMNSLLNTKGTGNTWHGQRCSPGTQLPWPTALFSDKSSGEGGPCPLPFPTLGALQEQGQTKSLCYLQLDTKVETRSSCSQSVPQRPALFRCQPQICCPDFPKSCQMSAWPRSTDQMNQHKEQFTADCQGW